MGYLTEDRGEVILPNPERWAHTQASVICVFWFNIQTHDSKFSLVQSVFHKDFEEADKMFADRNWLRGRFFYANNDRVIMIYNEGLANLLSQSLIQQIKQDVYCATTMKPDYFIDHSGVDLMEKKHSLLDIVNELNESRIVFDTKNIYDFYALEYSYKSNPNAQDLFSYLLNDIKRNILTTYIPLVHEQLAKYASRGRVVGDMGDYQKSDLNGLLKAMELTRRSDMKRSNVKWEELVKSLIQLENVKPSQESSVTHQTIAIIDHIYNLTHNIEGGAILSKFGNGGELKSAFDFCHSAKDIKQYLGKVSPEVEDFINGVVESKTMTLKDIINEVKGLTPEQHIARNVKYQWDATQTDGAYVRIFVSEVLRGFKVGIKQVASRERGGNEGYVVVILRTNTPIKTSEVLRDMGMARTTAELYKREVEDQYAGTYESILTEKINKTDADFMNFVYNPQEKGKPKSVLMADFYVLNSLPSTSKAGSGDTIVPTYHKDTSEEEIYPSKADQEDSQEFLNANEEEEAPKEETPEPTANESLTESVSAQLVPVVVRAQLNCYNYLKDHMLETVYFSLSAEVRHVIGKTGDEEVAEESGEAKNYAKYASVARHFGGNSYSEYQRSYDEVKKVWGLNNVSFVNMCFNMFKDPTGTKYPKNFLKHWDKDNKSEMDIKYSDNQTPTNQVIATKDIDNEIPEGTKGLLVIDVMNKNNYDDLIVWADHYKKEASNKAQVFYKGKVGESVLNEEDEENAYPPAPEDDGEELPDAEETPATTVNTPNKPSVDFNDVTFKVDYEAWFVKIKVGGHFIFHDCCPDTTGVSQVWGYYLDTLTRDIRIREIDPEIKMEQNGTSIRVFQKMRS